MFGHFLLCCTQDLYSSLCVDIVIPLFHKEIMTISMETKEVVEVCT